MPLSMAGTFYNYLERLKDIKHVILDHMLSSNPGCDNKQYETDMKWQTDTAQYLLTGIIDTA